MTIKERKPKIELVIISEVRRFCLPNTPKDVCDPWWEDVTESFGCDPWGDIIAFDDKIEIRVIKKREGST